jgi:hypothetical protein
MIRGVVGAVDDDNFALSQSQPARHNPSVIVVIERRHLYAHPPIGYLMHCPSDNATHPENFKFDKIVHAAIESAAGSCVDNSLEDSRNGTLQSRYHCCSDSTASLFPWASSHASASPQHRVDRLPRSVRGVDGNVGTEFLRS